MWVSCSHASLSHPRRSLSRNSKKEKYSGGSLTGSVSSEFTKLNPTFDEEEENEAGALYDMGAAKDDKHVSATIAEENEAGALYDMGNNVEENKKKGKVRQISAKRDEFGFDVEGVRKAPEEQSLYDNSNRD